jgi:hypothetical protein
MATLGESARSLGREEMRKKKEALQQKWHTMSGIIRQKKYLLHPIQIREFRSSEYG